MEKTTISKRVGDISEQSKKSLLERLDAFEMHENELFEQAGVYKLVRQLSGNVEATTKLRSSVVCFLRKELGNKKGILYEPVKDDVYLVPNKYKDPKSLRIAFFDYICKMIDNNALL